MDTEILIVGAGVFGLNVARALKRRGAEVLVVESDKVGAGASATPLGVLAPHAPDRWNAKKQAQFEALTALPAHIGALEAETGIGCGYRQTGRLIPLENENIRDIWAARKADAQAHWRGKARIDLTDPPETWIAPDRAPFGAVHCGLSARLDARGYLAALEASVGKPRILCKHTLTHIEGNAAHFENRQSISARHIVLANGTDAFRFLPDLDDGSPAGRGEKGQAAIMRLTDTAITGLPAPLQSLPTIYSNRIYVVPRGPDTVAVGATSERWFSDPENTDEQLDMLIDQARNLCPALENAEVIERWARLRPRSADRKLLITLLPDNPNVTVATGGFKTGLAMAHTVGKTVAANVG